MNLFRKPLEERVFSRIVMANILAAAGVVLPYLGESASLRTSALFSERVPIAEVIFAATFAALWQFFSALLGVYSCLRENWLVSSLRITGLSGVMTALLAIFSSLQFTVPTAFRVLAIYFLCAILCQLIAFWTLRKMSPARSRALVVGSGRMGVKAWRQYRTGNGHEKEFIGFMDHSPALDLCPDIAARFLGDTEELAQTILKNGIDEVMIATEPGTPRQLNERVISIAGAMGVRVLCLREVCGVAIQIPAQDEMFVELLSPPTLRGMEQFAKRLFDVSVASVLLLLASPVLLAMAIYARVLGAQRALSSELKIGFRRKQFRLFTLASTPAGLTRRIRIDRLPQMWSVLRGEMSLVGPPPMSAEDLSTSDILAQAGRFNIRPGLVGAGQFTQSSGTERKGAETRRRHSMSWSLRSDLRILARALVATMRKGEVAETNASAI